MWSKNIETLNPYEAVALRLERERRLAAVPVLHRTTPFSAVLRRLKSFF